VIFHDHGTRYLGKMFNDDWMRDRGFLPPTPKATAQDLVEKHKNLRLITVNQNDSCENAFALMQKYDISQIPVVNEQGAFTGSLEDVHLYSSLLKNKAGLNEKVQSLMQPPFPVVAAQASLEEVSSLINKENNAVLMMDMGGNWHIITRYDVIAALTSA